ncbi:MAG: long-chain fatty acid--CoA ligase [candidate division WOR-3 bacterium]|nr:long-chain fatty acid--CoA ligase [candidate division WOR-3 bacterium]
MADTIYQYFVQSVVNYPKRTALMYKKQGKYQKITYKELSDFINTVAFHLQQLGVKKGDTVGIYSYNRPEWVMADLATLKLGAIVVPIYHVLSPFYVKYIINDAKIKILFVENKTLFDNVNSIIEDTPSIEKLILFDDTGITTKKSFIKFSDMTKSGNDVKEANGSSNDIATIVYTSGTTAEPKGAVLTHHNIISNAVSAIKLFDINCKDVIMSYLPLSHMFERTAGYYVMIFAGATIGYAENFTTIVQDVAKIKPTVLITLPRVLEKAYQSIAEKVNASSKITKSLVYAAIGVLNKYTNRKYKKLPIPRSLKIKRFIYDMLVAKKFRKIAGGRLRLLVSGGAPLDRRIAKIFQIVGINICEGYGLTETSPVISACTPKDNRLGTVGKIFPGVQVKIGENDEILVKGPNVMLGYHNKPEETAKAIDKDGWFHTGDQGKFDEFGNLIITGRLKELIVTSYGKKIPPIPIEEKLCKSKYIEQAVLYGDKKNFIIALIVPKQKAVEDYAKSNSIVYQKYPELLRRNEIKSLFRWEIDIACKDLAPYEKIKAFALITESFTIENGLLTPTLKLRRSKIFEKYHSLIEETYEKASKEAFRI